MYTYRDARNMLQSYSEFIPNLNLPVFNFKEVLTQNVNTINRTNILSFDQNGASYYSYIVTLIMKKNLLIRLLPNVLLPRTVMVQQVLSIFHGLENTRCSEVLI